MGKRRVGMYFRKSAQDCLHGTVVQAELYVKQCAVQCRFVSAHHVNMR